MNKSSRIVGASFSLSPMCDNFVEVIEMALGETDTSMVWLHTDDVTTTVRGEMVHVFDVTKGVCLHAAETGEHVSFQATYGLGCPGDVGIDDCKNLGNTVIDRTRFKKAKLFAAAKFSLYPLGDEGYSKTILDQIELMKQYVKVSEAHYSTRLEGGLLDIFNGLERVFQETINSGSSHTVMTVTISINSPSHKP